MKTSISSDVWEKKKALIAKLYMEEEWPLKQVIKQIRSDDFNPSETQLRSRLKKWRVTKPSRQTRKKAQSSSSAEPDSDRDVTRQPSIQRPLPRDPPRTRHDWPGAQSIYAPVSEDHPQAKWNSPLVQQLTPSPSGEHTLVSDRSAVHSNSYPDLSPTATSFDHAHASPVGEALMVNTTSAMAPSYPASSAYPLSPESCLPSPGGTANTTPGIAWPPRSVSADYGLNSAQWFQLPFEAITPPNGVAQTAAPIPPSLTGYLPPASGHVYHQYPHYQSEAHDYHHGYGDKNWKRAMSLQYDMGGQSAGREHADRKQMHGQSHGQPQTVMSPSHTQSGPQSVMCAPIMPYMGQDHYQKPPGIGY
ncbi:hypothetical protein N7508_003763 [Penicillium antarcticum]|nr:uncharacterized protein N7508_003763 [Penicillium antarcticum]KAJ5312933.1 hypothetical protein N7508_003763 [Penicillium antarcticum]